jgi:LysM repeat protein
MNRMKIVFLLCISLLVTVALMAQDDYLVHTVKKGETLSAIAKHFHTTTGDIMRLNGMTTKSILKIGEKIKIPPAAAAKTATEITTTAAPEPAAVVITTAATPKKETGTSQPILHAVGEKETLYGIGKKYNVSVSQITSWNKLKTTNIHKGQHLIVGYMTVGTAEAVPVNNTAADTKVTPQVINAPAVIAPQTSTAVPVKKTEAQVVQNGVANEEGVFASFYQKVGKEFSGAAATFKTASGWLDKKYYVLMNNVTEGTVVKVASNNKTVYAKVLGPLPDIKEDSGLLVRISNAAAASLGISDNKFPVTVHY